MLQPNSIIEIFKGLKLNRNSEDTLRFFSVTGQNTFFESLELSGNRIYRETNFTYIRPESKIRVKGSFAQLSKANYLRFYNMNFDNKWYYAFVREVKCLTETDVEITFELDDMQTWLPGIDYTLTECRILRQHQAGAEVLGDNTEPESIQIPAYHPNVLRRVNNVPVYEEQIDIFENGYYIAMMFPRTHQGSKLFFGYNDGTYDAPDYKPLNGEGDVPFLQMVDNVPCENVIVLLDMTDDDVPEIDDPEYDQDFPGMKRSWLRFIKINRYWGEYIYNTWIVPKDLVPSSAVSNKVALSTGSQYGSATYVVCPGVLFNYDITYTQGSNYTAEYLGDIKANEIFKVFSAPLTTLYLDYAVKNKKLLMNPFCYFEITSPNGQTQKLSFEDMHAETQPPISGDPNFPNVAHKPYIKIFGSILDNKISCAPYGYNFRKYTFDKQSGLPTPPVGAAKGITDTSTQTGAIGSIIELGTMAIGTAIGGPAGTVAGQIVGGGAMAITQNTMPQGSSNLYNLSNITMWAENIRYFTGAFMVAENYQAIDNFFQAYGYTQNRIGVPAFGRTNWNYIQTDRANFQSITVPADAMERINKKFDSGVRFHRTADTIGATSTNGNPPIV